MADTKQAPRPDALVGKLMNRRHFLASVGAVALTAPLFGCEPPSPSDPLRDRWLRYIRRAGSGTPPATWKFLGGDVTDCVVNAQGKPMWIGADWFAGARVKANDTYAGNALPFRNGAIFEPNPGSFSGAFQILTTRNLWLDGAALGKLASNTHWWPIAACCDRTTGKTHVACWHTRDFDGTPYGTLLDNHIITLNGYATYASHVRQRVPVDNFWIDGLVQGSQYTFIYGEQFFPDYEDHYGIGDPENHYTVKRVARVPNGQLTNIPAWRYWDGHGWVADIDAAVPMVDTVSGLPVQGDAGVKGIAAGHWLLAAHRLAGPNLDVYRSANPQGPWEPIAAVPLPGQGAAVYGGTQVGQLVKILPRQVLAPPVGSSIAIISRNVLNGGNLSSLAGRTIQTYAPQFAVIPNG
jgi:hypothetical protein